LPQTFQKITDRLSSNQKKFIAEVAGTFIVVVLATGSVVIDAKTNGILGIPFIAFAPFVGVAIGVYLFGKISMAHFNPAVTVGFLITKHIMKIQLQYYLTAEIIGALLASLFVKYVIGSEAYLGSNVPNYAFPLPIIFGMYCTTCKPIVERQLKDEKAVKNIDIDYITDSIIVEFDPSIITKEEIKNRLEKSGYMFVRTAGK
jgi:copper chaperone CopZ